MIPTRTDVPLTAGIKAYVSEADMAKLIYPDWSKINPRRAGLDGGIRPHRQEVGRVGGDDPGGIPFVAPMLALSVAGFLAPLLVLAIFSFTGADGGGLARELPPHPRRSVRAPRPARHAGARREGRGADDIHWPADRARLLACRPAVGAACSSS